MLPLLLLTCSFAPLAILFCRKLRRAWSNLTPNYPSMNTSLRDCPTPRRFKNLLFRITVRLADRLRIYSKIPAIIALFLTSALALSTGRAAITVYTIGDSTVANYTSGFYPQTGYGQVLQPFFNSAGVVISNKAVGGTSSKSFYENQWPAVRNLLKPGDFVTIGFGINDSAADVARRTEPFTTFKQFLTRFVNDTKARGAFPILVSTINRSSWTADGKIYPAYHDYPVASRQLAGEIKVPLIDLDRMCTALLEPLGQTYSNFFIYMGLLQGEYPNLSGGAAKSDTVHLQENGAYEMARLFVKGIRDLSSDPNVSKLIPHLLPTYRVTFTSNNTGAMVTRSENYPAGARVTAKVRAPSGATFTGWSGDLNGTANPNFSLVMTTTPRQINANFNPGTTPTVPPPPAGTTYQFENGTLGGATPPVIETTNAGYSGTGYLNLSATTSSVTFLNVSGNGGGTKALVIRYALGSAAARTGNLVVNGVSSSITFNPTGSFTTWLDRTVNVTLNNTNTNTIQFTSTGDDFANLDRLTVPPGASSSITYQAESATVGGTTPPVVETINAGYSGSGYVNFMTSTSTLTFSNVEGGGGGAKTLAIRYALGSTTARTGNIIVNGAARAVTFQPTGAFTTWQTLNVAITLNNSSANTIQLTSTGNDLANVDQITIP